MRARARDEKGASVIELVLYTPLLMIAMILTIQFSLTYLAKQSASAAAREAARVARVTGDAEMGRAKGASSAASLGKGLLMNPEVQVARVGDNMRATVSGKANQLLPFFDPPRVTEVVQGRIEQFQEDGAP
ncbi:TadE/TadG family type IV pilus assembly protein [Aeromicrobium duanguangcaii]|uniref:Pilus assembly protein n=1 Tax=Aeromicrobium duanguangcaii TaxID=2968086 RepID=A0ABY5KDU4_9ACTN|nr:TadE/TadG family type IV pilus assembly protein [Aeromicrobium duanguangcaii]MCD9154994.1 pilus assembly protein [Aeromicrobium duanguangcaii]MCL3839174.1 pilus assembly protein [Aeromicrobium duanguangcaii]UUI67601.1 pilus assembly protein [Aeromicrobium duanguangcaii]